MTAHGLANGTYRIVDPVPPRRILSGLVSCVRVRVRVRVRVHVHVCVYMGVCVCVCVCGAHGVQCAQGESRTKASFTESHRCHAHSGKLDLGRIERGTYTRYRKRLTLFPRARNLPLPFPSPPCLSRGFSRGKSPRKNVSLKHALHTHATARRSWPADAGMRHGAHQHVYNVCFPKARERPGARLVTEGLRAMTEHKLRKRRRRQSARASVPELDEAIPAARSDLGGLNRVPDSPDTHAIVRLDFAVDFGRPPVPQPEPSVAICGCHQCQAIKPRGVSRCERQHSYISSSRCTLYQP